MMPRSLSPPVCANSVVVIATVWVISGGKQSLVQNAGFTLSLFSDQIGSPVIPASTALFSTAEKLAPRSPAGSSGRLLRSLFAASRHIRISMLVTEPGDVKLIFLPTTSLMELIDESFWVIQRMSAILSTPPPMILRGCPELIARMAAGSATSPNGRSPASVLRTEGAPPAEGRLH